MTIRSAKAISLDTARGLVPRRDALMISILGSQEAQAGRRPRLAGWRSVLVLEFEDSSENEVGRSGKPGDWPANPTGEEHAAILGKGRGRVPSLSDAKKIVEFVSTHQASDEDLDLIVHCQAGVSRSVMVAHKVQQWLGLEPYQRVVSCLPYANQRLAHLLELARNELGPDVLNGSAQGSWEKKKSPGP